MQQEAHLGAHTLFWKGELSPSDILARIWALKPKRDCVCVCRKGFSLSHCRLAAEQRIDTDPHLTRVVILALRRATTACLALNVFQRIINHTHHLP